MKYSPILPLSLAAKDLTDGIMSLNPGILWLDSYQQYRVQSQSQHHSIYKFEHRPHAYL